MINFKYIQGRTQDNAINATKQLLHSLRVRVTNESITECLLSHPNYPSLLSISDCLKNWKVDNLIVKVANDQILSLPTPFMTLYQQKFVIVLSTLDESIVYIDNAKNKKTESLEYFLSDWEQITLLTTTTNESGEVNYTRKKRQEVVNSLKIPVLFIFALLITLTGALLYYKVNGNLRLAVFLSLTGSLKILGILFTGILLWYDVDKNPFLQHMCTAKKNVNCNAVLTSSASKLWGISWSEIGFFYFAGSWIIIQLNPIFLTLTTWLSVMSLPYTLFSLFYQWKIVKEWCLLCIGVQALLLLDACFFLLFAPVSSAIEFSVSNLELIVISCMLPLAALIFIKTALPFNNEVKKYKYDYMRLKYDSEVFTSLLQKQKSISKDVLLLGVTLGDYNGENWIVKVCNPYCEPCAKSHKVLDMLLREKSNIRLNIIFTATTDENDIRLLPVKHLLHIALTSPKDLKNALNNWYEMPEKNYLNFKEKYSVINFDPILNEHIEKMNKWCKEMQIEHTPTLFVNGYQLPETYTADDLRYLLQ